jgi:predicted ATPase
MRKLTVKNFSVIKEAELEFGKITVLIGPQSSGKSLLCKLAYFLSYELIGAAVDATKSGLRWEEFETLAVVRFSSWFPPESWVSKQFSIQLKFERYVVGFKSPVTADGDQLMSLEAGEAFKELYAGLSQAKSPQWPTLSAEEQQVAALDAFVSLQDPSALIQSLYVPAGRAFFTNNLGSTIMQNPALDPIIRRFNAEIIWNPARWKPGLLASMRGVIESLNETMNRIAGGTVVIRGSEPALKTEQSGVLPFSVLSSGTQELLPLFNLLDRLAHVYEHTYLLLKSKHGVAEIWHRLLLYVEEPEVHIFPKTQYELVQLFAWLANDPILSFSWVITTHSPYILSSFNNLIEAGQAARNNPQLHDEVAKIIPEQYWIKQGDFKAYAIEDGKLKSILNDSGFVEGNYLDQVSETIGDEFDRLIKLEYDHAKAS